MHVGAALREQAMFAKANWKAKFGSGFATSGSRDGKALAKEAALAGQVAAERLAKAMADGECVATALAGGDGDSDGGVATPQSPLKDIGLVRRSKSRSAQLG